MTKSPLSQALTELVNSIRRYVELRLNIVKLELLEKSARTVSLTLAVVFLLTIFLLFLFFFSLAAALWAGDLLQHKALGYLCVAAFYLLLCIILFFFRRKLFLRSVIKHLSEIFFEGNNKKSDEED